MIYLLLLIGYLRRSSIFCNQDDRELISTAHREKRMWLGSNLWNGPMTHWLIVSHAGGAQITLRGFRHSQGNTLACLHNIWTFSNTNTNTNTNTNKIKIQIQITLRGFRHSQGNTLACLHNIWTFSNTNTNTNTNTNKIKIQIQITLRGFRHSQGKTLACLHNIWTFFKYKYK